MSSLLDLGHKYRCEWFHILTSWFRNPKKRKVTFSEDETAVVEIEEDGPAYGAADTGSPAPAAAGQEEDTFSGSNVNMEKAEEMPMIALMHECTHNFSKQMIIKYVL